MVLIVRFVRESAKNATCQKRPYRPMRDARQLGASEAARPRPLGGAASHMQRKDCKSAEDFWTHNVKKRIQEGRGGNRLPDNEYSQSCSMRVLGRVGPPLGRSAPCAADWSLPDVIPLDPTLMVVREDVSCPGCGGPLNYDDWATLRPVYDVDETLALVARRCAARPSRVCEPFGPSPTAPRSVRRRPRARHARRFKCKACQRTADAWPADKGKDVRFENHPSKNPLELGRAPGGGPEARRCACAAAPRPPTYCDTHPCGMVLR